MTRISELPSNTIIKENDNAFVFVVKVDCREAKGGKGEYLTGEVFDGVANLPFKVWGVTSAQKEFIKPAACLVITAGKISMYNENPQVIIDDADVMNQLQMEASDIVPTSKFSEEQLTEMLDDLVSSLDDEMKTIVETVYSKYGDKLRSIAGGMVLHHNTVRGLYEHHVCTAKIVDNILCNDSGAYEPLDKALAVAAALVHDLGKITEFEVSDLGLVTDYTKNGSLLGHLFMGGMILKDIALTACKSKERAFHFLHIILSHHNDPVMGAIKPPATKEAFIVAQADMIDAALNAFENETYDETGKVYSRFFSRYIHKS